ncbi:MAG: hypothetical protein KIH08_12450, partial [Candidatus Freyarchaeota archaeon]|nr:hypothetical protein [Candidatus Jordarchaeia archaeon]
MAIMRLEFGRRKRKIPVIGIRQVGKSYFFFTLAHIVSELGWGEVDNVDYFHDMFQYILNGLPIPPTMERTPINLFVDKVDIGESSIPCNFYIYTEDFGGAEFEELMRSLAKGELSTIRPEQKDLLDAFINLFRNADGIIIMIDVVRLTDG